MKITKKEIYKHYIALDWSQKIVAIASMRDTSIEPDHTTILPDVKIMKQYLKSLIGKKILTIEETTTSHCYMWN